MISQLFFPVPFKMIYKLSSAKNVSGLACVAIASTKGGKGGSITTRRPLTNSIPLQYIINPLRFQKIFSYLFSSPKKHFCFVLYFSIITLNKPLSFPLSYLSFLSRGGNSNLNSQKKKET